METKKSKKADLEKKRPLFFQIGLIIAFGIIILAFEWETKPAENEFYMGICDDQFVEEIMQITRERQEIVERHQFIPDLTLVEDITEIDQELIPVDMEGGEEIVSPIDLVSNDDEADIVDDFPYLFVEEMPTFKGGDINDFRRFILSQLRYPEEAVKLGISGKVFVKFVIDQKGNLVDAGIWKSEYQCLDEEALRVVRLSPEWNPGKHNGHPVRVQYVLPVLFSLQ